MLMAWPKRFTGGLPQRNALAPLRGKVDALKARPDEGSAPTVASRLARLAARTPHPSPSATPSPARGEGGATAGVARVSGASSSHPQRLMQLVHPSRELGVGEGVDDLSVLHDEEAIGQSRGEAEVLLDQEDGEAVALELGDGAADLLDDDRRQALGRLVEHEKARAGAQDPGDRQHLLLSARELAAAARKPLAEVGEERIDALGAHAPGLGDLGRQEQVLLNGEAREDRSLLRTERDAEPCDPLDRQSDELAVAEHDRARTLADDAHDRLQGGRLARAVPAEQGHDLALAHVEIDTVEDVRFVVPGLQTLDREHGPTDGRRRLGKRRFRHVQPPYRPPAPPGSPTPCGSRLPPAPVRASRP